MKTYTINTTGFCFNALCIAAALITYTSMYAFRKPLSAATFEGLEYWGMDYKVIAIISQLIGYTCSKFLGIKIVGGMKPGQRIAYILGLIGTAWAALLLFAVVPAPANILFLVLNGLPLGMIFGIVISFLEGRKNTELLGAGLCVSFITASGITKAVGKFLILHCGVSDFWMPFLTGLVFVPLLLLGVWLLGKIPPPSTEDARLRGNMQRRMRQIFPYKHHDADIRGNHAVRGAGRHRGKLFQILPQRRIFRFARQSIEREIELFAPRMRILNRTVHLFNGKISCRRTHPEAFSGKIDGVRTIQKRHFHFFKISCRR